MGAVVQFVLALTIFGVTVSGGSLLWPRLTKAPRPEALQKVHDIVLKTPQGEQAAQVLGVTDDKSVQPIDLGQVANNAWKGVKSAVAKRAQTILVSQVTQQLNNQYQKLPKDQQQELRQIICTSSPSATPSVK